MRLRKIIIAVAMVFAAAAPASAQTALYLSNGAVYTVDDVTHTSPQEFTQIVAGEGSMGTLHILDGRLVRSGGFGTVIGFSALGLGTGTGVVNVMGNHSRLETDGRLDFGTNNGGVGAVGILNIGAGGQVRAISMRTPGAGSVGHGFVTISGPGSLLELAGELHMHRTGPTDSIVTIGTGGTLSVGTIVDVGSGSPEIRLEGGTLSLTGPSAVPPASVLKYSSGSFRFRSGQTLDGAGGFYTNFYGSPPVLVAGRGLVIDGTTTLATSLTLAGGSLRTVRIAVNPATGSVTLAGGTLTLTGDGAVVDDGGDFGPDPLTVGDGAGDAARLELRGAGSVKLGAVTVATDGAISFGGEALLLDSLDNSGSVTVMDAILDARGGLVNTGSLRLVRAVVEGDVSSPAGSTIDVTGTVVFNGAFSGAGNFYGSGTVIFNGTFNGTATFDGTGTAVFNGPASSD